mgnify:CR=1 FL=1
MMKIHVAVRDNVPAHARACHDMHSRYQLFVLSFWKLLFSNKYNTWCLCFVIIIRMMYCLGECVCLYNT